MGIIEFPVKEAIVLAAEVKAEELGTLNNSITRGMGNVAGFVGEFVLNDFLGGELINDYEYDILTGNKKRIEVKTKVTSVTPSLDYEGSVSTANLRQKCDYYAFMRVNKKLTIAWLCGFITPTEFKKSSRFLRKGEFDGSNTFKVRANCYNMYYRDMPVPKPFLDIAEKDGHIIINT